MSTKITKKHLRDTLCEKIGLGQEDAHLFINQFFEEIAAELEKGGTVKLAGLGTFSVRDKVSRPGRNPRTGEHAEISARRVVTFKPSKTLNKSIRENLG